MTPEPRLIHQIAAEIAEKWDSPYFGAKPYLEAMLQLDHITDSYYQDSAQSVVSYFLSNAQTWRGEDARRLKQELKDLLPKRK